MAENLETPEKSLQEDDFLPQLSYKQLQQLAMSFKLPANLKQSALMALIKARQCEDIELVERIVSENRQSRNRGRLSRRTTSTSPSAESLTLSPPASPPECLEQMSAAPLASSSPKNVSYQSTSMSLQLDHESLLQAVSALGQHPLVVKPTLQEENSPQVQCSEFLHVPVGNGNIGSSGTHSTDRSPDLLETGSLSTNGTNSVTNSIGSDVDPLIGVTDSLDFSGKETLTKNFTELKPVPPSELMDLSLPVPVLDSSLALRQTLGTSSLQDSLLPTMPTSLTQALIPYTTVQERMLINNPLVNLCTPDSTMDGHIKLPTLKRTILGTDYAQAKPLSDPIPQVNFTVGESTIVGQQPNSLKRTGLECEYSPTKFQKVSLVGEIQLPEAQVSTSPSKLPVLPAISLEDFPKISKSLSIVALPTQATTCTAVIHTMTSTASTPESYTTSYSEREKFQPSVNSSMTSKSFSEPSATENIPKSTMYLSDTTRAVPFTSSRKVVRSVSTRSTKKFSSEQLPGAQSKSNIQTSEFNPKVLPPDPKKVTKGSGVVLKIAQVQLRPMAAPSQALPLKMSTTKTVCYSPTNPPPCPRQSQTIRPPSQAPMSLVTTTSASASVAAAAASTGTSNVRRLDVPTSTSLSPFAMPAVPTRSQPNIALPVPRPGRPESALNFPPTPYSQISLPSFNILYREVYENQKCAQNRQLETCPSLPAGHADSTGDPLLPPPSPLPLQQPRLNIGTALPPVMTKPFQMDFPPVQSMPSTFVGQNLPAVGQSLSHDNCFSTFRHLWETPVYNGLQNRDPGRRPLHSAYQYDNQNFNQVVRPQGIPVDHYKDIAGIGPVENYSFQMHQNFPRMPYLTPKSELLERPKTKAEISTERLLSYGLPKSLEIVYNYRSDAPGLSSSTSGSKYVASLAGAVSYQPGERERHRWTQEFVPYSSNYGASEQQGTEMYGAPPFNAAMNQSCQPAWFPSDPACLPAVAAAAMPVNQYWPQAINHQPTFRLPQPFRPVNSRNAVPNHYFPLKSMHALYPGTFFSQSQTNNVGCYQAGIPGIPPQQDSQLYQPPEPFDNKVLPMQDNMPQFVGQDPLAISNQALNQCQNQVHQDVPDFQGRGDQLSLSMIYNYLTSTDHQMPSNTPRLDHADSQMSMNQRPVYSRPIFSGTNGGQYPQVGNGGAVYSTPAPQSPAATSATTLNPARAKCGNGPAKTAPKRPETSEQENTTLTKEDAHASVSALRRQSKKAQRCANFENGCSLTLPLSQLAMHEEVCEYINLKCPKESCEWNGRARKLATHVREVHRAEISTGTDSKYNLPNIEALENVCFLQEVSRKLFAICVSCHGGVLCVSIQYIASGRSERPTSASGCIEVVGHDGRPHSWLGKLLPYFQPVETLLNSASCLEVSLSTLGSFAGSTITLHVRIRVYSGNTSVSAQPSN